MARVQDSQSEKVGSNPACALQQGTLSSSVDRDVNGGPVGRK